MLLLLRDALRSLRAVGGVAKRLALLNLLIDQRQWVLHVRRLLLIERSHAELLVDERLVFATRRSVAVMCVVSEGTVV